MLNVVPQNDCKQGIHYATRLLVNVYKRRLNPAAMILNLTSDFSLLKCRFHLLSTTLHRTERVLPQNVCQDSPPLRTLTGPSLSHTYLFAA
jgi:hypothetical protein